MNYKNWLGVVLVLIGGGLIFYSFFQPWITGLKIVTYTGFKLARNESPLVFLLPVLVFFTVILTLLNKISYRGSYQLISVILSIFVIVFIVLIFKNIDDQIHSIRGKIVNLKYLSGIYLTLVGGILQFAGVLLGYLKSQA